MRKRQTGGIGGCLIKDERDSGRITQAAERASVAATTADGQVHCLWIETGVFCNKEYLLMPGIHNFSNVIPIIWVTFWMISESLFLGSTHGIPGSWHPFF